MKNTFQILVLAAGKGTRMKSSMAKVLHHVYFAPMIHHLLDAVKLLQADQQIVVVGHQEEQVKSSLQDYDVVFAHQSQQLGTGHAVLAAEDLLSASGGCVMILCGDTPLIRAETLENMAAAHRIGGHTITVMTTNLASPSNYGRIVSGPDNDVLKIVEEKDATPDQREIAEVNAGIYCVEVDFLCSALKKVGTDNEQGEVYLTDIVEIAQGAGHIVHKFVCHDSDEILGVNSRIQLAEAHQCLQERYHQHLMRNGVTLYQPDTISIEKSVSIEPDTVIFPHTHIVGSTRIGDNCVIQPFTYIQNSFIGKNVVIGEGSHIHGAKIYDSQIIPPCTMKINL